MLKDFGKAATVAVGLVVVLCCLGAAGLKFSGYPNVSSLSDTDLFIVSLAGDSGTRNIRFDQLRSIMPVSTNATYTTITNTTLYSTTITNNTLYSTNITVVSNIFAGKSVYSPNFYSSNVYITNFLFFETNGYVLYTIATNSSATTNITVDMTQPIQTLDMTQNLCLFQTTNRPSTQTNANMVLLTMNNFSGGNLTVHTNSAIGWKIDGTSFPVTVSNGTVHTFTFIARGSTETNVLMGAKWFK